MKIAPPFFSVWLISGSILLCPAQASFEGLPHSTSLAELVERSQLIAVGTATTESFVIDPVKWYRKNLPPEARIELPNMREAIKGTVLAFQVKEVLKGRRPKGTRLEITVFSYEQIRSSPPHMKSGEQYVVFLTPLQPDQVAGLQGLVISAPGKADSPFNPKRAYTFAPFDDSVLFVDSSSAELIQRIKKQVRSSASKSSHKRY